MSPIWQATASALPPARVDRVRHGGTALELAARDDDLCAVRGKRLAMASPMPRLAPVTTATRPVRSNETAMVSPGAWMICGRFIRRRRW